MALHPAENRGYRELYLFGRQTIKRLERMAGQSVGDEAGDALARSAAAVRNMLTELEPLTAHDLYGKPAAQGGGARIGAARGVLADRFLERNMALRSAVLDLQHVSVLLAYLAEVSENRDDTELPGFCRSWERRLRRHVGEVRKAALALGADPDAAIEPLDPSPVGRAAHRMLWAVGTAGEWTDRQLSHRKGR